MPDANRWRAGRTGIPGRRRFSGMPGVGLAGGGAQNEGNIRILKQDGYIIRTQIGAGRAICVPPSSGSLETRGRLQSSEALKPRLSDELGAIQRRHVLERDRRAV